MSFYLVHIAGFVAGLLIGYVLALVAGIVESYKFRARTPTETSSFFAKKLDKSQAAVETRVSQVSIDDSKFVVDIKTDNISKTTEVELGTKTTQQDNINQSVSKLAQLKGR